MQESPRPGIDRKVGFSCLGCLGAAAILAAVGAALGWYFPIAQLVGGLAGASVGAAIAARGRPRVRSVFCLGTVGMLAGTLLISLNHNGPDPAFYLGGDAIGVALGAAAAFLIRQPAR